jgi:hypothetical protein
MITVTELRSDLYNKIDHVIATGLPLEIERKGHIVKIMIDPTTKASSKVTKVSKWSRLTPHPDCIVGDPEDLMNINWSDYGVF